MAGKKNAEIVSASAFVDFIRFIVAGEEIEIARRLHENPALAAISSPIGATRQKGKPYFFPATGHYLYAGDTALHMAAAAHSVSIAKILISNGADCRARNRRGAEPLHYAADGNRRDEEAQALMIQYLVSRGARPDAVDKSGVAPLHRAVRTRSLPAVRALLDHGANPRLANKSGSTPLHLAVQTTGASGSGSEEARRQQAEIILLLLSRGAKTIDTDANGKDVGRAATSSWVRKLLDEAKPG